MWNSIVSVPDHCLFIYFSLTSSAEGAEDGVVKFTTLVRDRD